MVRMGREIGCVSLDCFDFEKAPDTKLVPKVCQDADGVKIEKVITSDDTEDEQIKKSGIDISKIHKISVVTLGPVDATYR